MRIAGSSALRRSRYEQSDSGPEVVNSTHFQGLLSKLVICPKDFSNPKMTLCDRGNLFSDSLLMGWQNPPGSPVAQSAPFPPPVQSFFDVGLLFKYNEDNTIRAVVSPLFNGVVTIRIFVQAKLKYFRF